MHSGQRANLKSLFFPVCCHLSWLNKTRRRKREIGFSVNVNILIKANMKHSGILTKKIKLNYEGYANGGLRRHDYQDMCFVFSVCAEAICAAGQGARKQEKGGARYVFLLLTFGTYQNIGSETS